MALTVVRDEQLQLGDIDQSVKAKNTLNLRLENLAPQLQFRETDQALPIGLWRMYLNNDSINVHRNTAAGGDFSTSRTLLFISNTQIDIKARLSIVANDTNQSYVTFQGVSIAGTAEQFSLFRRTSDKRLVWQGDVTAERPIVLETDVRVRETPSGTVNGVNMTFTLAYTPFTGKESVYLNGILQDEGAGNDYTISGNTITFNNAPVAGDKIRVTYIRAEIED